MHYFIFPDIDTTLYQASSSKNTGLDEILEVQKNMKSDGTNIKVSRMILVFLAPEKVTLGVNLS